MFKKLRLNLQWRLGAGAERGSEGLLEKQFAQLQSRDLRDFIEMGFI